MRRKSVKLHDPSNGRVTTYECTSWRLDGSVIVMDQPMLREIRHRNGLSEYPPEPPASEIGMVALGPGWYAWESVQ